MNTALLLAARFDGSPVVPLDDIAAEFFGISAKEANDLANKEELPVPTFRARESRKAPRLVHVTDLARWFDAQRAKALQEWRKAQIA